MTGGRWVWGGLLGAGVGFEAYALRDAAAGNTLSACTRAAFRVDTPAGRVVFATAWVGFSAWYLAHVLKREVAASR